MKGEKIVVCKGETLCSHLVGGTNRDNESGDEVNDVSAILINGGDFLASAMSNDVPTNRHNKLYGSGRSRRSLTKYKTRQSMQTTITTNSVNTLNGDDEPFSREKE